MSQTMTDYFDALARLKANEPRFVRVGTKITNDSVALEAGRGKGSIKKSRDVFADLIVAIESAAEAQAEANNPETDKMKKLKDNAADYRTKWEAAIAREVCLLHEIYVLKKKIGNLTGLNILPIRGEKPF